MQHGAGDGCSVAGWGESLDCTDPSETRFSLQVKLDMEKIMEKLGGVQIKKQQHIGRQRVPVPDSV